MDEESGKEAERGGGSAERKSQSSRQRIFQGQSTKKERMKKTLGALVSFLKGCGAAGSIRISVRQTYKPTNKSQMCLCLLSLHSRCNSDCECLSTTAVLSPNPSVLHP